MYLMLIGTFPATSAADFGKGALDELRDNPYPDFTKRNYYFALSEDGVTMYVIYDIEEGKEEAALRDIRARVFKLSQGVKGLVARFEPLFGIEEAFSLISMAAPQV